MQAGYCAGVDTRSYPGRRSGGGGEMAATEYDLGNDDEAPGLPAVAVRFAGELGAPLVVVEAAILTPEARAPGRRHR